MPQTSGAWVATPSVHLIMLRRYAMVLSRSSYDPLPLSGLEVLLLSIGRNVSLADIQGEAVGSGQGLTTAGEPFGGSLEPQVLFGAGLIPNGYTHYRWSYRRLRKAGDYAWHALDQPVLRHYVEVLEDQTLLMKPYLLGPDPHHRDQALFRIPPARPPLGLGAITSFWAPEINPRLNAASAFFRTDWLDTGSPASGKYELKLELFNADGQRAVLTDVRLTLPTTRLPFGPARQVPHDPAWPADPREDLILRDEQGAIVALRLVLHIDNRPCEASISPPSVWADAPDRRVRISFVARHPGRFAAFEFETRQGDQGVVSSASLRGLADDHHLNGFVLADSGRRWKDIALGELLGPRGRVALECTLRVKALATDGWRRLAYLDRCATPRLFVLEADSAPAERLGRVAPAHPIFFK